MIDSKKIQPKLVETVTQDRQVCLIRFSPDGNTLVGGGYDSTVRRWNTTDDKLTQKPSLEGHNGWVTDLAFAGDRLFSCDSWGRLCCWSDPSADAPKRLWQLADAHDGWIRSLAPSPDGKTLATCGRDGGLRLWSTTTGEKLAELGNSKRDRYSVAWHPDDTSLVTGDLFGVVQHWDTKTKKLVREIDAKKLHLSHRIQDVGGVRCLVFDPEGKTLVVTGGEPKSGASVQATPLALFFDWNTAKRTTTIKGKTNDGFIFDLHLLEGGVVAMATSGQPGNGKLLLQRIGEKEPFFIGTKLANCHSIAVHPKGDRLVVSATNARSNGNGRRLDKDMNYPGNTSPLHVFSISST